MAAIPLVIITLDLDVTPLVVSTIMKGKPFQFSSMNTDRADEIVQWGKEEGPYARLRALGAGEGDSRFGVAIRDKSSRGSEKKGR